MNSCRNEFPKLLHLSKGLWASVSVRSILREERRLCLRQNIAIPTKIISPKITLDTATPIILPAFSPADDDIEVGVIVLEVVLVLEEVPVPEVVLVLEVVPAFVGRFVNSAEAAVVIIDPAPLTTIEQTEPISGVWFPLDKQRLSIAS